MSFNKKIKKVGERYTSHLANPARVFSEDPQIFDVTSAPEDVAILMRRVVHKSFIRMQSAILSSLIEDVLKLEKVEEVNFNILKAVNLKKEAEVCALSLQEILPKEEFDKIEVSSIHSVIEDSFQILRKEMLLRFCRILDDSVNEVVDKNVAQSALLADCVLTTVDKLSLNTKLN